MTDTYKATPEQWQHITDFRLLELQARIELLEAQAGNLKGSLTSSTPPPVATDEELLAMRSWSSHSHTFDSDLVGFARAIYNLGIKHGQASSREVAEPAPVAGGLVARVIYAICRSNPAGIDWYPEARAAILEVATWLREQEWEKVADLLEEEAGR
jgi:hypothetical protein